MVKLRPKLSTQHCKNTAISPNFLVWKFCGKAQFWFTKNYAETKCAFLQNFHTRKLGKIAVFFAVQLNLKAACAKRGTIFQRPFIRWTKTRHIFTSLYFNVTKVSCTKREFYEKSEYVPGIRPAAKLLSIAWLYSIALTILKFLCSYSLSAKGWSRGIINEFNHTADFNQHCALLKDISFNAKCLLVCCD